MYAIRSYYAFKLMTDPFVGQLTFIRVYSGVLNSGATVYNSVKGKNRITSYNVCYTKLLRT